MILDFRYILYHSNRNVRPHLKKKKIILLRITNNRNNQRG